MGIKIKSILGLVVLLALSILVAGWAYPANAEEISDTNTDTAIATGNLSPLDISGLAYYEQARSLISKVNELRASLDLEPLVYNLQLEDLAFLRAAETSIYWDHQRPDGSYLIETNPDVNAENIAGGLADADQVFANWLHSEGHYENMVNPELKSIGIAAYSSLHGEAPRWWAQVFSTTLPENTMPERQDRTVISHRIKLDSSLLRLHILTGSQISAGILPENMGQEESIRLPLGASKQFYAMAHYDLEDVYSWPGSLATDELNWQVADPSIAEVTPNGELKALSAGTTTLRVSHKELAGLETEIGLSVVPTYNFALLGRFASEKTTALAEIAKQAYLSLPSVDSYVGESTAEANAVKEQNYRFYDEVQVDSNLQRLAYALAKQYSLFMYADSMDSLPQLEQILDSLPAGARVSWHAFSNLDNLQDQTVKVPGWAKSVGVVVLESGGCDISILLYSNQPADGQSLSYRDLVPLEEQKDPETGSIAYQVSLFVDRADISLYFLDQGNIAAQVDVYDPLDYRFTQNEHGQLIYQPSLLLQRDEYGPYPPVNPDLRYAQFALDNPEVASFTEDGKILIRAQGSFTLRVDLVDPLTNNSICQAQLLINNYVPIPESELPIATAAPIVESEPSEDGLSEGAEDSQDLTAEDLLGVEPTATTEPTE
ncbi:MAG: CAP domain-containing protein [Eubacteriales bacterium]|nr:CAP domain-containing protein [Eubacteriales bacterium]